MATIPRHRSPEYAKRQRLIARDWDEFGNIVHDYLGIPYKSGGRAVRSKTYKANGIATREVGLVCTSFVDVVLSRYVCHNAEAQLPSYNFGKRRNIFDQYGMRRLGTDILPGKLTSFGLLQSEVYGIVFHMKEAWEKKTRKKGIVQMEPGSRIHVGFIAFRNGRPFLVHASGPKGVHIIAWQRLLNRFGDSLTNLWGPKLKGPKFLSVYKLRIK